MWNSIVIDTGSFYTKIGQSCHSVPKCMIRTAVGLIDNNQTNIDNDDIVMTSNRHNKNNNNSNTIRFDEKQQELSNLSLHNSSHLNNSQDLHNSCQFRDKLALLKSNYCIDDELFQLSKLQNNKNNEKNQNKNQNLKDKNVNTPQNSLNIEYPYYNGMIDNIDNLSNLWLYGLTNKLGLNEKDISNARYLLSEPCFWPNKENDYRSMYVETIFEDLNGEACYLCKDSVLSTFGAGKTSGMVFDFGHSQVKLSPVFDGFIVPSAIRYSEYGGGNYFNSFLKRKLTQTFLNNINNSSNGINHNNNNSNNNGGNSGNKNNRNELIDKMENWGNYNRYNKILGMNNSDLSLLEFSHYWKEYKIKNNGIFCARMSDSHKRFILDSALTDIREYLFCVRNTKFEHSGLLFEYSSNAQNLTKVERYSQLINANGNGIGNSNANSNSDGNRRRYGSPSLIDASSNKLQYIPPKLIALSQIHSLQNNNNNNNNNYNDNKNELKSFNDNKKHGNSNKHNKNKSKIKKEKYDSRFKIKSEKYDNRMDKRRNDTRGSNSNTPRISGSSRGSKNSKDSRDSSDIMCINVNDNNIKNNIVGIKEKSYLLPDGQRLVLGDLSYGIPELFFTDYSPLFEPEYSFNLDLLDYDDDDTEDGSDDDGNNNNNNGNDNKGKLNSYRNAAANFGERMQYKGIVNMLLESMKDCDIDSQRQIMRNIVVTGGNSSYNGLIERIGKEFASHIPSQFHYSVIYSQIPKNRLFTTWKGGAILANLKHFQNMWITKDDYDEHGSQIVFKKCLC